MDEQTAAGYQRSVDEGERRLHRSSPALLATGAVGGIDVSVGVLAFFLVEHETHSKALGALAFTIGFIALTLANSELFTENFLVPIAAMTAKRAGFASLIRLWVTTALTPRSRPAASTTHPASVGKASRWRYSPGSPSH